VSERDACRTSEVATPRRAQGSWMHEPHRTAPRWDNDNDRRTGTYLEMIQNQGWIR